MFKNFAKDFSIKKYEFKIHIIDDLSRLYYHWSKKLGHFMLDVSKNQNLF